MNTGKADVEMSIIQMIEQVKFNFLKIQVNISYI